MDITEVILSDHHEQRRMFAMLDDMHGAEAKQLATVWGRLRILLEVHAAAEEALFYPRLLEIGAGAGGKDSPESETTDAVHDHNEIRDAIRSVTWNDAGSEAWWKAVANVNRVNGDHMAEEEREGLADFRRHADLQTRHELAVAFCAFEAVHSGGITPHDVDPDDYVEDYE